MENSRYFGIDLGHREMCNLATASIVSGSCMWMGDYPISESPVIDPREELRKMVIDKFIRQLVPNPAEHVMILKHFDPSPMLLLMLMFHKREVFETAVALETETLRKEHIDYENITFQGDEADRSFSLKNRVMKPPAPDPNLGKGDERIQEKK